MSRQFSRSLLKESLSNSLSRLASRARTPAPDGEENGAMDVNFLSLEELLSKRLESLQTMMLQSETEETENRDSMVADSQDFRQKNAASMNKARIQSDATTINDIVNSLQHSRSEVSSHSRELLLAQLYKMVVTKPIVAFNADAANAHAYVTESTVLDLVKLLTAADYRSPTEFILLFRSAIALVASDMEDFGEIVSADFLAFLEGLISAPPSANVHNENKANVVTGFCGLLLVLYGDTSAFGVDDKVKWLLEYAQGYIQSSINMRVQLDTGDREYSTFLHESDDKRLLSEQETRFESEKHLAISAIHGVGLLLSLLRRGDYLNELLSFVASELLPVMDDETVVDLSRAAAKVIALCYEMYTYDKDDEDDDPEFNYNAPLYEQDAVISMCKRLGNLLTRKVGKKEKKDTNSVFTELENTIANYTDKEKREEIYKLSPTGTELLAASVSSTQLKLSRSKVLAINSWSLYFRLLHLKWVFGFGLHNQLMENFEIKSLLKANISVYQEKYSGGASYDDPTAYGRNARTDIERFTNPEKKRANDLKKARESKITEKLEDLNLH